MQDTLHAVSRGKLGESLFNVGPDVEGFGRLVYGCTTGVVQQLHPLSRDQAPPPLLIEVALQA